MFNGVMFLLSFISGTVLFIDWQIKKNVLTADEQNFIFWAFVITTLLWIFSSVSIRINHTEKHFN